MPDFTEYTQLADLIERLVSADGSWESKRDRMNHSASADQRTALNEFGSWFQEEEESTEEETEV